MTPGPLQQHDSRFRERNLLLFALLGLVSCARRSGQLLLESCPRLPASELPSGPGHGSAPRSLLLALGVLSFGKTVERHVTGLVREQPRPRLPGVDRARPEQEVVGLRSLLR
jgi:hypothetical protein